MQPNNPFQPQKMPQSSGQPFQQPGGQPLQAEPSVQQPAQIQQPVLESPILSPTHFDPKPLPANVPQGGVKPEMNLKHKLSLATIVLGAVAAIAMIISIVTLVNYTSAKNQLAMVGEELETKNAIVDKIATDTNLAINTVEDVPEYAPVSGYIYIPEWGIKIQIPEAVHQLSYILDQKYRPEICFNGLEASAMNVFPAFADIDRNPGGMGCLMQVADAEGDSDSNGYSFGELAYSYGGYNYFYRAPEKIFSEDEGEQQLEQTAVQIIKNMLMNNISNYE